MDSVNENNINKRKYEYFYLVKWSGYDDKYNTWEPYSNLQNLYSVYFKQADEYFSQLVKYFKK